MPDHLTTRECAETLHYSRPSSFLRWARREGVRLVPGPCGRWLVPRAEMERLFPQLFPVERSAD